MRQWLLLCLIAFSPAVQAQVTVATDRPVNGAAIEVARTTIAGSYCRAPLGPYTLFKLDHGSHLLIVQPALGRAAGLSKSDILAYRDARAIALQSVAANNRALAATPGVDPKIKAALAGNTAAPDLRIAAGLLRAPTTASPGSGAQPDLVALEQALAAARQDIADAGLSNTILGMAATCIVDVGRFPATATRRATGETRILTEQPLDAAQASAVDHYAIVPLYELMEGLGQPAATRQPT